MRSRPRATASRAEHCDANPQHCEPSTLPASTSSVHGATSCATHWQAGRSSTSIIDRRACRRATHRQACSSSRCAAHEEAGGDGAAGEGAGGDGAGGDGAGGDGAGGDGAGGDGAWRLATELAARELAATELAATPSSPLLRRCRLCVRCVWSHGCCDAQNACQTSPCTIILRFARTSVLGGQRYTNVQIASYIPRDPQGRLYSRPNAQGRRS